jgi:hypothetical protein
MTPGDRATFHPDSALRVRIYVSGQLVRERWLDAADPDALAQATAAGPLDATLCEAAEAVHQPWLVEVYDPAQPEDLAYMRFGTDRAGMVEPVPGWCAPVPRTRPRPDQSGPMRRLP